MNWKVKYINYPQHFRNMEAEVMETIRDVLSRGDLILRKQTDDFEANLAAFCGSRYAVGVGNCTEALYLAYRAAGIGPGDEVITTAHTFVATVSMLVKAGATPILVDIGDDHNIDRDAIEAAITPRTKAIVPVSLNGRCCDLPRIKRIAEKHHLVVVEDSAQALGATVDGKPAGTFGVAGCFSFYPAKLLGAFGDAGAIITDDPALADRVRLTRNHGRRASDGEIVEWSFNCRIDNLHAAILDLKLKKLPEWLDRRRAIARLYSQELAACAGVTIPPAPAADARFHDVYQNFEIEAENRDGLVEHLRASGVETMLPWSGKAVHQFAALKLGPFHLPRTDRMFQRVLMLPMYPELTDDQAGFVAAAVRKFYRR
jgi:dTDP-4-amino-4,6-dideoxygalactose transaminase